jgi:hypothetical protein
VSQSIGEGLAVLALAIGFVGYWWIERNYRLERARMAHELRLKALEQGVPLVELDDPEETGEPKPPVPVMPILGLVLAAFSLGAMIVMAMIMPVAVRHLWITPLPILFMGIGLVGYHVMFERPRI